MRRRGSTASSSACWRSATRPMWNSAPSARRSTSGSRRSAASASAERVDCDLDFAEPAAKWIAGTLKTLAPEVAPDAKVIAVDFGAKAAPNLDVVEAEVTEHINLNSSRSAKETIHLELSFDGAAPAYKPGDSLDIYAENDPRIRRCAAEGGGPFVRRRAARRVHQEPRRHHALAQDGRDLCDLRPSLREGAARVGRSEELDRRPPADRPGRCTIRSRSMPRSCAR